jgi:bacterioferritin
LISSKTSIEIIDLLNAALARELQVSVQYMLQHILWSGNKTSSQDKAKKSEAGNFVTSHSPVMFPSSSLKKIAVTEMRHAERIGERISFLTGELRPEIPNFELGESLGEIFEIDIKQEEIAI